MMSETDDPTDQHATDASAGDAARRAKGFPAEDGRLRRQLASRSRQLAESEARYWTLVENLQDIVLTLDPVGRVVRAAGNTMGILGYTAPELLGACQDGSLSFLEPDDRAMVQRACRSEIVSGTGASLRLRARDRAEELRWLEARFTPIRDEDQQLLGVQAVLHDVSDLVQAERFLTSLNAAAEAVQRAALAPEQVFDAISEQLDTLGLSCGIALVDDGGRQLVFTRLRGNLAALAVARRLAGMEGGALTLTTDDSPLIRRLLVDREIVFLSLDESFAAMPLSKRLRQFIRALVRLLPPLKVVVVPLVADDRALGILAVAGSWLSTDNVPAVSAFASQAAIALRNAQLLNSLRESEARYRGIFSAATDGFVLLDDEDAIVEVNQAYCAMHGYDEAELRGRPLLELVHPDYHEQLTAFLRRSAADQGAYVEARALHRHGHAFPIELRGSPIVHHGRQHLLAVVHDITDRQASQEALVRSEKLHALGQMAGGIAHDFNNILVSIRGYADMALYDLTHHPDMVRSDLERVMAGANDAAEAVRRLQSLYRQAEDTSDFAPIQLDQLVAEALALTQPHWKDQPQAQGVTIAIDTDLRAPRPVMGNASELRRVLTNLIVNAVDAMPAGGTIRLATRQEGRNSLVSVSDTGVGIDPAKQSQVFEPFFTTKGGAGSGLGLTVSQNIVERHGGRIALHSAAGQGATFTVMLPSAEDAGAAAKPTDAPEPEQAGRPKATVLVVDDELSVRALLERLLQREGQAVTLVTNGRDALAQLEQRRYDLLITDLGMPDVSGHLVAQRARARYPQMPIILCTGWGDTVSPEQLQALGGAALLSKPFTHDELVAALRLTLWRD